jgi:hypothetical protein
MRFALRRVGKDGECSGDIARGCEGEAMGSTNRIGEAGMEGRAGFLSLSVSCALLRIP